MAFRHFDFNKLVNIVENCKRHDYSRAGEFIIIPRMRNADTYFKENYFYVNTPKKTPLGGWNKFNSKERTLDILFSKMQMHLEQIDKAKNDKELYEAVKNYNDIRALRDCHFTQEKEDGDVCAPAEYLNAFLGDGTYWSMMTMVKYLGLYFVDDKGQKLTRDECIAQIANKVYECGFNSMELFEFCEKKFFSGLFNWKKYKNK